MDDALREAWERVVAADEQYILAVSQLPMSSVGDVLGEALGEFAWRRTALKILEGSTPEVVISVLPELFSLALVTQSLVQQVRRIFRKVPKEELANRLPPLVASVLDDPEADWEAYRRLAELLRDLEQYELLSDVVWSARQSSDPDILEVADDF